MSDTNDVAFTRKCLRSIVLKTLVVEICLSLKAKNYRLSTNDFNIRTEPGSGRVFCVRAIPCVVIWRNQIYPNFDPNSCLTN